MTNLPRARRDGLQRNIRVGLFLICLPAYTAALANTGFSAAKAGFSVKFKDEITSYRVTGMFVLPKEAVKLEALEANKKSTYVLRSEPGRSEQAEASTWLWRAPQTPGFHVFKIFQSQPADSITFHVFVMIPFEQLRGEYLNGYRIGKYPTLPLKQLAIYKPPRGFIEITPENQETLVSPHFKLKQFLCKQEGKYPKYIVLHERLLLKLELILEQANAKGYRCDTFHVMSGYRTPYYNKAIGNVQYSRHVYGSAADIFIDVNPKDDMMDDLNGDGKSDHRDAAILYDLVDAMYDKPWYAPFIGGLATYKKTASHGPFVHVDTRGFRARWGK